MNVDNNCCQRHRSKNMGDNRGRCGMKDGDSGEKDGRHCAEDGVKISCESKGGSQDVTKVDDNDKGVKEKAGAHKINKYKDIQ